MSLLGEVPEAPVRKKTKLAPVDPSPVVEQTSSEPEAVVEADDPTIIVGTNSRVRAGNAMDRARAGAVAGALDVLARKGVKALTMGEVAKRGGLARATLYNHVRDKTALLAVVAEHEVRAAGAVFASAPSIEEALERTATWVAEHPVLVTLRRLEPAVLAGVSIKAVEWEPLRLVAADALTGCGLPAGGAKVDLLIRWLLSFMTAPSDAATRASQARTMVKTLV